ncbi:uncharacterized protein LOC126368747 isoform X1 [Pectinophora gossypiella]|uniref:uncharacterized protein LOC126368747 isoform X1 n=1 Tax=Pectinophora gossypiella TaxID=13191 RepID=UPI00214EF99F|nr:uncharacterized protein LOC126368747 isoform X1 [Pectinophora gossypiella]
MGKILFHYTSCLIVLTFCIGRGDGRWKKRDRENFYHDIDVFKRMAEKIEHEIDAFYEDYPDEQIKGDDIEKIRQEYVQNILEHTKGTKDSTSNNRPKQTFLFSKNITNELPTSLKMENSIQITPVRVSFKNNESLNIPMTNWPKFEDILLEMGKRYDWKNDRWIKVKRKLKGPPKKVVGVDNSINFHEKHKFSYRTVKLNRKSRRNVVIAVTAVR